MSAWTGDELAAFAAAEEVHIAPRRRDGTLRNPVTVWVVRIGDDLYVRSVRGREGAWFGGIQETHSGQIRAGRVEKDVSFVDAGPDVVDEIDEAYRTKYRRYAGRILNSVLTPEARVATMRLSPLPT